MIQHGVYYLYKCTTRVLPGLSKPVVLYEVGQRSVTADAAPLTRLGQPACAERDLLVEEREGSRRGSCGACLTCPEQDSNPLRLHRN